LFISSGHDLFGSLLVIILTSGIYFCILPSLLSLLVTREIYYWLCLVLALWLKLMILRRNRGPSVCAHTRLCYSAHTSITVGSHNPLWDYINMLSLHELFLPCEIHYWCHFYNGVMVKDLWSRGETESLLCMHTQDFAAWRMTVPKSLVMIHYGITLMCYLPSTFPWNNFYVVGQVIKQHLSSLLDQKGIPLSCVVSFLLILVVTTHTSSLCILVVKVKPWSFLVLENNWLALKMEIGFPCCWDAGVCSFAPLFNPCIPKPSQFISHEETDEQPDQMDFYPNAWPFASKCELSTLGLPMVLRGLAQCQK
jgi:hypothetical protein